MRVTYNGISGELSEKTIQVMKERHGIDFMPEGRLYAKVKAVKESGSSYNKRVAKHPAMAAKGVSRNELMLQAKEQGIKNFRILNKEELVKVLDPNTTEGNVRHIIKEALARWKAGWGSRKKGGELS